MNKSPLTLFIILLIVLVVSVLLCKMWNHYCQEGLIGFGSSVGDGEGVSAKFYNATTPNGNPADITKLHDSIFFDESTTRLIHLTGVDSASNEDLRNSISNMTVYDRDSTKNTYPVSYTYNSTSGSNYVVGGGYKYSGARVNPSYKSIVYTVMESNPALTNYAVVYIPWGMSTVMHIMDLSQNVHLNTYAQIYDAKQKSNEFMFTKNAPVPGLTAASTSQSPAANTMTDLTNSYWPKRKCLKVIDNTYLDTFNGNLVVYPNIEGVSSAPTIYNRYNDRSEMAPAIFTSSHKYFTDASLSAPAFTDVSELRAQVIPLPNNLHALYVSTNKSTLVAIMHKTNDSYGLLNTIRLESDGTYSNSGHGSDMSSDHTDKKRKDKKKRGDKRKRGAKKTDDDMPDDDANDDEEEMPDDKNIEETKPEVKSTDNLDYNQWLDAYYSSLTDTGKHNMNNYILKTQIVPPVCPSCGTNACAAPCAPPVNTAATAPGPDATTHAVPVQATLPGPAAPGQQAAPGQPASAVSGPTKTSPDVIGATGNVVRGVVSETTGIAKNIVSETTGLAKETAAGAIGLTKDVVAGTAGLAKETAAGAVGLTKDIVSGTAGLAKETASGAVGFVKDAASGVVGLAKDFVSGTLGMIPGTVGPTGRDNGSLRSGTNGQTMPPTNRGMLPPNNLVSDPYSYYGQLSHKPSNEFRPLTADFSSFGR